MYVSKLHQWQSCILIYVCNVNDRNLSNKRGTMYVYDVHITRVI
jgi:hypothetical protein